MSKGPSNVQQTTSNTPNPVAMAQLQTAVNTGNSVASQPYQTYNSPLVAGMNGEQQAAFNNINSAAGLAQPYIGQATNLIQASTSGIDPTQTLNQYMSPYTQNVLQAQQAIQNQQMGQAMTQSAGSSGAAGANNQNSDRAAIAQGLVGQQLQMANNAANTNTLQQGYNQAMQTGLSAQQANAWLESQGANTMANLGAQAQGQGLTGANAMLAAGNQIQQQAQNQINAPLAQYNTATQYPFQIANYMGNLGSLATGMGGQASTSVPSASPLSQIAGLGLTGYGLYNNLFGGSSSAGGGGASSINDTAATLNNLIPNYGSGIANAFTSVPTPSAHGGRIQHRDAGGATIDPSGTNASLAANAPLTLGLNTLASGSMSPIMQAGLGSGNPMATGQLEQFKKMPTEQLHEMAVRSPNNPALMQALRQRQMNPQASPMNGGLGSLGGTGGLGGMPGGVAPAMAHGGFIHAREGSRIVAEGALGDADAPATQLIDAPGVNDYSQWARRALVNYPPAGGVVTYDPQTPDIRYVPEMSNQTGLVGMMTHDIPEGGYQPSDISAFGDYSPLDLLPKAGTIGKAQADREMGRPPELAESPAENPAENPSAASFMSGPTGGLTAPGVRGINQQPEYSRLAMDALNYQGPTQDQRGIYEKPGALPQFGRGSPFTDDQIQHMLQTGEMIDPAALPPGRSPTPVTGSRPAASVGPSGGTGSTSVGQGVGLSAGAQANAAAPGVGNAGLGARPRAPNGGAAQEPTFSDRLRTAMSDPLTMLGMHLMAGQSHNPLTNLGSAMSGTQQQVESQAMRQAQARLAMAKEAATEEYQRGRLENSANRTDIYGERVRDQAAAAQARVSQIMAMAVLRGSQNPKNDTYNELLVTVNPATGQRYTRPEAYGFVSGLEQRAANNQQVHDDRVFALQSTDAYRNASLELKRLGMSDANVRSVLHDAVQLSAATGKPLDDSMKGVVANYGTAQNVVQPAATNTQPNPNRPPITNFIQ